MGTKVITRLQSVYATISLCTRGLQFSSGSLTFIVRAQAMTQSLMTEQVAAWIALIAISSVFLQGAKVRATTFEVTNKCPYTVWAAASPGGGQQLAQGQSWTFQPDAGASSGRIWGRTVCSFNGSGQGSCQTGDCDGLLECKGMASGPTTLVEYSLNVLDLDFYDISLVDGFNLPLSINPTSRNPKCHGRIACLSDINSRCPNELKLSGGACQSGCYKYKTDDHCCRGTAVSNCNQTLYSTFFKDLCPDAYSYAKDNDNSTFTCPTGDDYQIVFCGKTDSIFAVFLYISINDDE